MNFCTLFDTNYLSRGLALHASLLRQRQDFRLFIFPFDQTCFEILTALDLPNVTLIPLEVFEDSKLLAVKPERSRAEYSWTCTSSIILHVLENFPIDHCTYLDADLYFFADPKVLMDEMGEASVLITDHRFSPMYQWLESYGKYCVQFMTFRRDEQGLTVLKWWRDACLEWCFARREDGKFGDQKYLDDWLERFPAVHELQHLGGGVAPWNIQRYSPRETAPQETVPQETGEGLAIYEAATGQTQPVVFYHFHNVKFLPENKVDLGFYQLQQDVRSKIYAPYLRHLMDIGSSLEQSFPGVDPHGVRKIPRSWKASLVTAKRKILRRHHVYPVPLVCQW